MSDQPTNEELRVLDEVLGDTAIWAEPRAGLEDDVVRAIADAPALARPRRDHEGARRVLIGVAAAVAAAAIVFAIVGTTGRSHNAYDAQLTATQLAPAAHASAGITHARNGFHITLDSTGLPALTPDQYFEAWLKNAQGAGVPIGTFSSSSGQVTLWSGVSPSSFTTIAVTIETIGEGPGSSGRIVLQGVVHAH
jgi:anti-sigma-K factor RskA